jgi:hypothetical protein
MNNADKHLAHWSNTDVQKYLNGELSAREMHDLEQQALDDPFLADALEGLQTRPGETLRQDLSGLRARLDTRVTAKPAVIPWRAIRVAAAVILLVGLGFTAFYTLPGHKRPSAIAKTKAPAPAPSATANQVAAPPATALDQLPAVPPTVSRSAAATAATSPAPATEKTGSASPTAQNGIPDTRPATRPTADAKLTRPATARADLQPVESRVAPDSSATTTNLLKDTIAYVENDYMRKPKVTPPLQAVTIRGTSPAFDSNPHLVAFSGRVLDLNNRPVAGASLTYRSKGTVTGAVTDAKGEFSLTIPQKDTTRQLTVAMEGYQETQFALNTTEQTGNTIYLRQNQPELSEVVVSGIGAQRKEYMAAPPSDEPEKLDSLWLNTAPAMGRIAYLDYLASARRTIPVDTTIHGTESISFRVDKKGALTEFRIERSLSPAHDAGVIRLITEGPPWKMLHGRSARALVNVTFP